MVFSEQKLLLDNFRVILKDYSVDVQDIVRSAILDDIDISGYIQECKNNPYKLEQIRLAIKEGISSSFFGVSGSTLYSIRGLNQTGFDLSQLESKLEGLSEECIGYVLKWVADGINISDLNLSIIPNSLLGVFDYGLRNNFSMKLFNTGYNYSEKYIMLCLNILSNKKPIDKLLSGTWSLGCLGVLSKYSAKVKKSEWGKLLSVIDELVTPERLNTLTYLVGTGISLSVLQKKQNNSYVYSDACLEILYEGYLENIDIQELLKYTSETPMKEALLKLKLAKKRKVSGRLVKH